MTQTNEYIFFHSLGNLSKTKVTDQCVESILFVVHSRVHNVDAIERSKKTNQDSKKYLNYPHSVYWNKNLRTSDVYNAQDHNKKTTLDDTASYLLTHFFVVVSVAWAADCCYCCCWCCFMHTVRLFTTFFPFVFFFLIFVLSLLHLVRVGFGSFVRCALSSLIQLHFHSCFGNLIARAQHVQAHSIENMNETKWYERKIHHCALLDAVHAETKPMHWKWKQYDLMLCT